MNAARNPNSPPPEVSRMTVWCDSARLPAARSPAARSAWWVLGAPALALPSTFVFVVAGAPGDWIGALWLVAVLWTIAASLVQALWAGFRCGDWSAFACTNSPCATPPCAVLPCAALPHDDEDHDFAMRTGKFAYLRIRDGHEALMREDDRYLDEHDHTDFLG